MSRSMPREVPEWSPLFHSKRWTVQLNAEVCQLEVINRINGTFSRLKLVAGELVMISLMNSNCIYHKDNAESAQHRSQAEKFKHRLQELEG